MRAILRRHQKCQKFLLDQIIEEESDISKQLLAVQQQDECVQGIRTRERELLKEAARTQLTKAQHFKEKDNSDMKRAREQNLAQLSPPFRASIFSIRSNLRT